MLYEVITTALSPVFPARIDDLLSLYPDDPINVENSPVARMASVGMDFLETLDIPLVRGRTLRPEDLEKVRSREATPVLINEAAMQAFGWVV